MLEALSFGRGKSNGTASDGALIIWGNEPDDLTQSRDGIRIGNYKLAAWVLARRSGMM